MQSGTTVGAGNITAGQFLQPIFDYTFPELLTAGDPMPVNAFDTIPYLARGSGPYVPGKPGASPPATPTIVGQLFPWPGATSPSVTSCAPPTTSTSPPSSTPTPAVNPTKDTIVITSATGRNQKGATTITILATTSSKDPSIILSFTTTGQNPVGKTSMTLVTPGSWSAVFTVKSKPTSVTVTSNFGGGPVTANVA